MPLHPAYKEQLLAIEEVFEDCPIRPILYLKDDIIIMDMPDLPIGMFYANLLMMAGWIALCFPNRFCDKSLIVIHLRKIAS